MNIRGCVLLLFGLSALSSASAQQFTSSSLHRFIEVPADQGLLVVALEPDSPFGFENAKFLIDVKSTGEWIRSFALRNTGTKPIRSFTVAAAGSGEEWGWEAPDPSHYIKPGETAPPPFNDNNQEIVALTDELRQKFKLVGEMQGIVCLTVVSVEYEDGTRYESKIYQDLRDFFEELNDR